jgi:two-component system cell cycle response regulator CpdR
MALKVLLVEDDASFSYSVAKSLRQAGFEVTIAGNYLGALKAIEEQHVDLLLTDVVMPSVNGFALARMARLRRLGLKVLFMTAYDLPNDEAFAKVLRKPITEDKLVEEVANALAA